MHKLTMFVVV